ncbi:MAG: bacterial Ig-like domain-containing protein, partial [Acholeplasmatales bacterium]|nr:bacterial Ig-like domain-containing protein [Acholeplasmatales bacterium]
PTKVSYYVGESLNLAGLVVVANYNDASTVTLTPGSYTVSGYNPTVSGPQTVTVTYQGQTSTFVVNVSLVAVSSVVIYFYPNKLVYHVGAELDLTGLVVVAYYNNGDEVSLNDTQYVVSGYNAQTVGKQTITITFNGQSDTFEVTVTSGPVGELDHLTITSEVTKKTYVVGEELDLAGLVVKAVYEDETAVTLSSADYTVSGYDKNTTGAQIITVTYGNKTATFTVSVNAAPAQSAIPGWVIPVIIVVVVLVGGGILAFFILKKGFKKDQQ